MDRLLKEKALRSKNTGRRQKGKPRGGKGKARSPNAKGTGGRYNNHLTKHALMTQYPRGARGPAMFNYIKQSAKTSDSSDGSPRPGQGDRGNANDFLRSKIPRRWERDASEKPATNASPRFRR